MKMVSRLRWIVSLIKETPKTTRLIVTNIIEIIGLNRKLQIITSNPSDNILRLFFMS